MNGEKLPEDVSAWDWLFGADQGKAEPGREGVPGEARKGPEGLPGDEGTPGSEGGQEGELKPRLEERPGFSDPWNPPRDDPRMDREGQRHRADRPPAEGHPPEVVVLGPTTVQLPAPDRFPQRESTAGLSLVRREDRADPYRQSWRRAVLAAVILGPPKATRGRFRPW